MTQVIKSGSLTSLIIISWIMMVQICLCTLQLPTDTPLPQVVEEAAWLDNYLAVYNSLVTNGHNTWNDSSGE
jgi:hypothetical protein